MAVKRTRDKSESYELPAMRLFREDLEEIAKAVEELGLFKIKCDDTFEADSFKDFADLPARPTELIMVSVNSGGQVIEVELSESLARVTLTEPDTLCRGILARIEEVCHSRRRRFAVLTGRDIRLPLPFPFPGGMAPKLPLSPRVIMENAYRADRPSFWRRTRDDWAVETIVGTVFLVVGFILGKITD